MRDREIIEILRLDDIEDEKAVCCLLCGRPFMLLDVDSGTEDWNHEFCTKECFVEYHKIKLMEEMRK